MEKSDNLEGYHASAFPNVVHNGYTDSVPYSNSMECYTSNFVPYSSSSYQYHMPSWGFYDSFYQHPRGLTNSFMDPLSFGGRIESAKNYYNMPYENRPLSGYEQPFPNYYGNPTFYPYYNWHNQYPCSYPYTSCLSGSSSMHGKIPTYHRMEYPHYARHCSVSTNEFDRRNNNRTFKRHSTDYVHTSKFKRFNSKKFHNSSSITKHSDVMFQPANGNHMTLVEKNSNEGIIQDTIPVHLDEYSYLAVESENQISRSYNSVMEVKLPDNIYCSDVYNGTTQENMGTSHLENLQDKVNIPIEAFQLATTDTNVEIRESVVQKNISEEETTSEGVATFTDTAYPYVTDCLKEELPFTNDIITDGITVTSSTGQEIENYPFLPDNQSYNVTYNDNNVSYLETSLQDNVQEALPDMAVITTSDTNFFLDKNCAGDFERVFLTPAAFEDVSSEDVVIDDSEDFLKSFIIPSEIKDGE